MAYYRSAIQSAELKKKDSVLWKSVTKKAQWLLSRLQNHALFELFLFQSVEKEFLYTTFTYKLLMQKESMLFFIPRNLWQYWEEQE